MSRAADALDTPVIVSHTEAVLGLKLDLARARAQEVSISVEIGSHLLDVKGRLAYGDWGRWLKTRVSISQPAASGFMKLATIGGKMPEKWLNGIAPLGQTKAIRACYASDGFRPKLSATWTWKGVKAVDMTADEFDAAVDAADPGHKGRKPKGGKGGSNGSKPAVDVPLDPPTLADLTTQLKELRKKERDPRKWKPLLDWILGEFELAGAAVPAAREEEDAGSSPAPTPTKPAGSSGRIPGLTLPGLTPGAGGAPVAILNPDGKARLQSIIAILRQLEKETKALVDAKSKVGAGLKAEALDAASDVLDVAKKLSAWVSGTPRK
jgi:hypothetical protein